MATKSEFKMILCLLHVALAVEGVSWSPDFVASVANGIVGTWDRSVGIGSTLHRHWLLLLQLEDQEKPQLRIHIWLIQHPTQIQGCWAFILLPIKRKSKITC